MAEIKIAIVIILIIMVAHKGNAGQRNRIENVDDKSYATEDAFDLDIQRLEMKNMPDFGVTFTPEKLQMIDSPSLFPHL